MKRKIKRFIIILTPLIIVSVLFYTVKNIKMSEISCRSQYGRCNAIVKDKLEEIKDCDYFACKKKIENILSGSQIIDDYNYQLKLPSKIEVNVLEKKPKYSIRSISQNLSAQIDSEGLVLDIREGSSLPGIIIEKGLPSPGEKVEDEEYFALELVYGATKIKGLKEAYFKDNEIYAILEDDIKVFFPKEGDRDLILGSLTLILNELKKEEADTRISERQVKEIDLRYNNPILR